MGGREEGQKEGGNILSKESRNLPAGWHYPRVGTKRKNAMYEGSGRECKRVRNESLNLLKLEAYAPGSPEKNAKRWKM